MSRTIILFFTLITLFFQTSCRKEVFEEPQDLLYAQAGAGTVTRSFAAVANVASCTGGYNIRFAGTINILTHAVVGADGVTKTYVRQWSIKGLNATTWSTTNPTGGSQQVGTVSKTYEVVAGHEMFAVQDPAGYSSIGMPINHLNTTVFIHQGTVVLQNVNDPRDKLVLRHQMVKTPNSTSNMDMPRMGWYINGQLCGM